MKQKKNRGIKWTRCVASQIMGLIFLTWASFLDAAEKINTSYISITPGPSLLFKNISTSPRLKNQPDLLNSRAGFQPRIANKNFFKHEPKRN